MIRPMLERTIPDMNWVLVDDVESLSPYVETFQLGRLVPLSEKITQFTDEDFATRDMISLRQQRKEEVFRLTTRKTEQTTYYTVLSPKVWNEMKRELSKPTTSPSLTSKRHHSLHYNTWFETYCAGELFPNMLTFLATNSAFIGGDTFWPIRLCADDKWRTLIAENVPPLHQFMRRKL